MTAFRRASASPDGEESAAEAISGMRRVVGMLRQADEAAQEVLSLAEREADRLLADAEAQAAETRAEADAYVEKADSEAKARLMAAREEVDALLADAKALHQLTEMASESIARALERISASASNLGDRG